MNKRKLSSFLSSLSSLSGFTLIELLVVVAITALISGIVISYSKVGENQTTLYVETQKIASAILRAKSLAIATFDRPTANPDTILCGYGFDIDYQNRAYRIFSYEPAAVTCSGIDPIREDYRITLPGSLSPIPQSVMLDATPSDRLWVVLFVPPAPRTLVSINSDSSVGTIPGRIYLRTADGNAQTVVTVGLAGQVDF